MSVIASTEIAEAEFKRLRSGFWLLDDHQKLLLEVKKSKCRDSSRSRMRSKTPIIQTSSLGSPQTKTSRHRSNQLVYAIWKGYRFAFHFDESHYARILAETYSKKGHNSRSTESMIIVLNDIRSKICKHILLKNLIMPTIFLLH